MIVARLDTKTGEMKVFVPTKVAEQKATESLYLLGVGCSFEWRISPSEVSLSQTWVLLNAVITSGTLAPRKTQRRQPSAAATLSTGGRTMEEVRVSGCIGARLTENLDLCLKWEPLGGLLVVQ
jgi:hypothetical protein